MFLGIKLSMSGLTGKQMAGNLDGKPVKSICDEWYLFENSAFSAAEAETLLENYIAILLCNKLPEIFNFLNRAE